MLLWCAVPMLQGSAEFPYSSGCSSAILPGIGSRALERGFGRTVRLKSYRHRDTSALTVRLSRGLVVSNNDPRHATRAHPSLVSPTPKHLTPHHGVGATHHLGRRIARVGDLRSGLPGRPCSRFERTHHMRYRLSTPSGLSFIPYRR